MPATEQTILLYIAFTQGRSEQNGGLSNLRASSLHVYLAAIRSLHVMNGYPLPPISTPRVQMALKAIEEAGTEPMRKSPITYELLSRICQSFSYDYNDKVWRAIFTLGFFGALRGAEYALDVAQSGVIMSTPLLLGQISFGEKDSSSFMTVKVRRSKTMPHGFTKVIGCTTTSVCAVCAMKAYLLTRRSIGLLFPQSYVFQFSDGKVLTKSMLNSKIKTLVSMFGLDPTKLDRKSVV